MSKHNLVEKYFIIFDRNFHVGERVQFKTWDEMVEEYGINESETISCKFLFPKEMKYLCGALATIRKICKDGRIYLTHFSSSVSAEDNNHWSYSVDMVKKTMRWK